MGRLIVNDITVAGFGSYTVRQTLHLGGRGPVAIVGENGSGKSTIASKALTWCLYGKCAPERMGASTGALKAGAVVNDGEQSARVQVWLADPERGVRYTVIRSRSKRGGETVEVWAADNTGMSKWGNDQAIVDRLIGADYEVFVRTCVRGQADPWSFAEASDGRKREILDVVSGAVDLIEPYERAKTLAKQREQAASEAQRRAEDAERRAAAVDLAALVANAAAWERDRASRLDTARRELAELTAAYALAQQQDAAQETLRARRAEVQARVPTLDMRPYWEAEQRASASDRQAAMELGAAGKQVASAQALLSAGRCPTCQQPIAQDSPVHRMAMYPLAALQQAADAASQAYREACAEKQRAEQWLRNAQQLHAAELAALPVAAGSQAVGVKRALDLANARWSDLTAAINPFQVAVDQAEHQAAQLQAEVASLRQAQVEAEHGLLLAKAWAETLAPKGVRAHMAEAALSAIEVEANRWLSVLSDGRMSIAFPATKTTDKGGVKEEIQAIVKMGGVERPLLNFSGGEKRRINLAVDLGVAAVFARGGALALSLLVLDEETISGMDEAGKAGVVHALSAAGVADVVVIDHDPRLVGLLPRTVRVQMTDGHSEVLENA